MVADSEDNPFSGEIKEKVPQELQRHLTERDGAAILVQKLSQFYRPEQIVHRRLNSEPGN